MLTNAQMVLSREDMIKLGHAVIDAIVNHFDQLSNLPLGRTATVANVADIMNERPPEDGQNARAVLDLVLNRVLPQTIAQDHPRYFATIPSPNNFVSVVADALASGFNVFAGNWAEGSGAAAVEVAAMRWLSELCGMPMSGGGLFVSGGSMANATALAVARYTKLNDSDSARASIYISDQAHSCFRRAARFLGMSPNQLRVVPTLDDLTIDVGTLRRMVSLDRTRGLLPYCVVANVGTTSTGAIDPLAELAMFCQRENLWFHGDGAFGAAAVLAPCARQLFDGIELLDSLAVDPHKWWFQPYEIGALLVREARYLRATFRDVPEYLTDLDANDGEINFYDHGFQLTRAFRALKFWMSIKTFGVGSFRAAIEQSLLRAERIAGLLASEAGWRVETGPQLAIVTFRYVGEGNRHKDHELEVLNCDIARRVREGNMIGLNTTRIRGRTVLRMCTINPRTTLEDESIVLSTLRAALRASLE